MFGGDWPLCTLGAGGTTSYADWARVIRLAVAPRSMAEQRKILYQNAVRVYGLRQMRSMMLKACALLARKKKLGLASPV